jgi:hypothetical protein
MKSADIEITTKIARFGTTTFQMSNIGSVSVYTAVKINLIAAALFVLGLVAGVYEYNLQEHGADPSFVFWITAAFIVAAVLLQMFWPRKEFTFVLKTSSNDVHKIVSDNGEFLDGLQGAIETAFIESDSVSFQHA